MRGQEGATAGQARTGGGEAGQRAPRTAHARLARAPLRAAPRARAPQAQFLQHIFGLALDVARAATADGSAQRGGDAGACAAALTLMASVLNWGLKNGGGGGGGGGELGAAAAAARRGDAGAGAALRPGQAWAALLLSDAATDWLLALLPALRGRAAGGQLAEAARQLVVSYCSLGGDLFPRPAPGEAAAPAAVAHCARMLRAALPWVTPAAAAVAAAAGGDEGELLDACRRAGLRLCAGVVCRRVVVCIACISAGPLAEKSQHLALRREERGARPCARPPDGTVPC